MTLTGSGRLAIRDCTLFVPLGHTIVAHRFIGGIERRIGRKAPSGAKDVFFKDGRFTNKYLSFLLIICRPYQDSTYRLTSHPPLKGWAIVGRPKGTKNPARIR